MINKPASVRARLLNKAKAENQDFSLVLTRYGLERLLYRLPASTPIGLTLVFGDDPQKIKQWQAFIKKNQLEAPALNSVIELLQQKLLA